MNKNKQETQRLVKNSKKWIEVYDQLLYGLKEIGDLKNWSEIMDKDLKDVEALIDMRKDKIVNE